MSNNKKQNNKRPVAPRGEAKNFDHLLTACTRDARVPASAKGVFAYMVQNRHAIRTGAVTDAVMRSELCMSDESRKEAIQALEQYGYLPGGGE